MSVQCKETTSISKTVLKTNFHHRFEFYASKYDGTKFQIDRINRKQFMVDKPLEQSVTIEPQGEIALVASQFNVDEWPVSISSS